MAGTTTESWDTLIQNSARTRHSDVYGVLILVIRALTGLAGRQVFTKLESSCEKSAFRRTANTIRIVQTGDDRNRVQRIAEYKTSALVGAELVGG